MFFIITYTFRLPLQREQLAARMKASLQDSAKAVVEADQQIVASGPSPRIVEESPPPAEELHMESGDFGFEIPSEGPRLRPPTPTEPVNFPLKEGAGG